MFFGKSNGYWVFALVLAVGIGFVMPQNSDAAFKYIAKSDVQDTEFLPLKNVSVAQIGSGEAQKITNFGTKIDLEIALQMISPKNWDYHFFQDDLRTKKVSWRVNDRPWTDALQLISIDKTNFVVNWPQKKIFIGNNLKEKIENDKRVEKKVVQKPAVPTDIKTNQKMKPVSQKQIKEDYTKESYAKNKKTLESTKKKKLSESKNVKVSDSKFTSTSDVIKAKKTKVWEIKPGRLKPQFTKWAEKAGYQLVWRSQYDYEIPVKADFHGNFIAALSSAVDSLYKGGTKISAQIYKGNKVVLIKGE